MLKAVSIITIPCHKVAALQIIWDIKTIEITEVKADAVQVKPLTAKKGTYTVRGHFAGLPWQNEFTYELNDKGFHSQEVDPPASGPRISGGFIVEEVSQDKCQVIHYEHYKLLTWMMPLKPFIQLYLKWSMWKELRDMRELILKLISDHQLLQVGL